MPIASQLGANANRAFVLVHCAPGDASIFARLAPHLAEHGRVVLVDLPDAGTSPDFTSIDPRDLVADVSAIITSLGPVAVTAVGLSFGAWVCARLASTDRPTNLVKLGLVGGYPGLGSEHANVYGKLAEDLDAGRLDLPALWEGLVAGCFPTGTQAENRAIVDAMLARVTRERAVRTLRRTAMLANAGLRVGPYDVPSSIVHARHDAVIPVSSTEQLAAYGSQAHLHVLDCDSHLLALTHVEECVAAIVG